MVAATFRHFYAGIQVACFAQGLDIKVARWHPGRGKRNITTGGLGQRIGR